MKIFFDYQIFTNQKYGGISKYFVSMAEEFLKLNVDCQIIAGIYRNKYLFSENDINVFGHYLNDYPHKTTKLVQFLNEQYFRNKIKTEKPDIIHETYYRSRKQKNYRIPSVLTVYDMIHEKYPNSFNKKDKTISNKTDAINNADHIICISQSTKKDLLNYYSISEKKISVIYLAAKNYGKVASLNINLGKRYILYVGQRGGYKNFKTLVEAYLISKLLKKNFIIKYFGEKAISQSEFLALGITELEQGHFEWAGANEKDLAELYAKASVFVYPSLYEGFGIPPLEAMSAGCPVIASNASSIPEVVGDAGVLFDPNNGEDLSFKLEKLLFSEIHLEQLKIKSLKRYEMFSWERCAKETLNVYSKIRN